MVSVIAFQNTLKTDVARDDSPQIFTGKDLKQYITNVTFNNYLQIALNDLIGD